MSLQILIFSAVVISAIIILIRIHPLLIIFATKLIFGKYNPRYLMVYKKFSGKSPYGYCIRDDFINHIAGFYGKSKASEIYETKAEITFGQFPFTSKYSQLFKIKGRPFCATLQRNNFFDLKIFGFRDELVGFDIRSYFHFIDGGFFMGEHSLKAPSKDKIEEFSNILQKKYLGGQKTKSEKFIIKGSNNVWILFEHTGFTLSIKYLDQGREEVNTKLCEFWDNSVFVIPEPGSSFEDELMGKL